MVRRRGQGDQEGAVREGEGPGFLWQPLEHAWYSADPGRCCQHPMALLANGTYLVMYVVFTGGRDHIGG